MCTVTPLKFKQARLCCRGEPSRAAAISNLSTAGKLSLQSSLYKIGALQCKQESKTPWTCTSGSPHVAVARPGGFELLSPDSGAVQGFLPAAATDAQSDRSTAGVALLTTATDRQVPNPLTEHHPFMIVTDHIAMHLILLSKYGPLMLLLPCCTDVLQAFHNLGTAIMQKYAAAYRFACTSPQAGHCLALPETRQKTAFLLQQAAATAK